MCGTVNDLAVGGAVPLYLSCAAIIEEGVAIDLLRRIAASMAATAREAGVAIVTGDTKVVTKGACDKLFITTTGVGVIRAGVDLGADRARAGRRGAGQRPASATMARRSCARAATWRSRRRSRAIARRCTDWSPRCSPPRPACASSATRPAAALATVLNEIAEASRVAIEIDEQATPIREEVKAFCEILGLDPLYLANEGKIVAVVPPDEAEAALAAMRAHPLGQRAAIIGRVYSGEPGRVTMRTVFGGRRIVDMLVGEQLPRIC